MLRALPLFLALLAPADRPLAPSRGAGPGPSAIAADTCPPPPGTDTITAAVVATIEPVHPADSLPPGYAGQFLAEVSRRLVLPDPLALVPYRVINARPTLDASSISNDARGTSRRTPGPPARGARALRLLLAVRLADGADARVDLLTSSLSPAADAAVVAAVQRIIDDGLVTALRGRAIDTRLLLRTVNNDSAGPSDLVLFRFRAPQVPLLEPAVERAPAPNYPPALRTRHESGEVRAEFVVGTNGRVVPGSLRFIAATHPEFALAVLDALPKYEFRPAEVGGCAVPQVVEMPFVFTIR
jgi:TonB family protein